MPHSSTAVRPPKRRKTFNRLVETKLWEKVSYSEYREKVRRVYDGPKGAALWACSLLSLHAPLGDRLFRHRRFDLRGHKNILDVGSGAGQIVRHLLKYSDHDANISGFDISQEMLRRARGRLEQQSRSVHLRRYRAPAVCLQHVRLRHLRLRVWNISPKRNLVWRNWPASFRPAAACCC